MADSLNRSRGHVCFRGKSEYYLTRRGLYSSLTTNSIEGGYRQPAYRVCYNNEILSVLNLLKVKGPE